MPRLCGIQVIHSDGTKEDFSPKKIGNQIKQETNISDDLANKIQRRVSEQIRKLDIDEISTGVIRSQVSSQLLKEGAIEDAEKSKKLGMSFSDFEALLRDGCNDNANIGYSPEMIAKYAYDSIAKEYALSTMPKECAEAHREGHVHCLSGNNNLIVKIGDNICIKNIVDVIDDLENYDIYVPSVNPKTNEINWKKIIDGVCTGIKEVFELEFSKGYKIECTSDHKFLKFNSKDNKFRKDYDICIDDFKKLSSIRLGSLNQIPYDINYKNYHESAFYGFFLGDGSVSNNNIQFHLKKEDKIEYIIDLLEKLNINYKKVNSGNTIMIYCDNFLNIKDKFTPISLELNHMGLLEGLINSDGYITTHGALNNNYLEFDSTNKFIMDLYFISCLACKIRPSYQKIIRNNKKWSPLYRAIVQNQNVDELLNNITLRKEHFLRLRKDSDKNQKVKDLTGLSPKKIKSLGEQLVYNITVEDNHNFMAGTQGFVLTQNCHDLEFFNTRPNCFNYNLQFFAKNGLLVDGKGDMGSVAKPAKTLEVLLNHLLQAFMAGAVVFSGGQGLANFNTLLAPFARGRTYEEIKQAIQGFVFNCNMSLICRGGQLAFTSIGVDLSIPKVLADKQAIGPGGVPNGVYADYKNEADLVFKAICEVINERDGNGTPHRFPNCLFNIREGDLDTYDGNCKLLHELGANNTTIYYVNCVEEESTVMGCRSRLPANYSLDYKKDCLNTGNFMYSTLNLPLIALDSEDGSDFYDRLDYYCEIIYDTLKFRREEVEKVLYDYHMSDFLLQKDKETGEQLYELDRCTYTIGFCGLYECMQILKKDYDVDYDGEDVLKFINEKKNEFFERDGLRWSVIASPAESTATRFAKINMEKYPELNIHQGTRKAPYLTNSSHIPVSQTSSIIEHIENANKYHKYTGGGNILHLWLGEVYSDPKSMWQLNKKIIEGNTLFWAYSKVFSVCRDCGFTINDKIKECPICKSTNIDWFDRVTGYYLKVKTWIDGKIQEFEDRVRHKIS